MAYEQKDGSFYLKKNEFKKDPKHPDFKARGTIGGVSYDAAVWGRKDVQGDLVLSLLVTPSREQGAPKQKTVATQQDIEEFFSS
jgi:hypothetical protein